MTVSATLNTRGWLTLLMIGCLAIAAVAATLSATDTSAEGPGIRRLDAQQAADLEARLEKLYARLAPAVVHLRNPKRVDSGFTGVIVSPAGEMLTCAHHDLPPKSKVVATLANGRKLEATILGSIKQKASAPSRYPVADMSMARLDEKGPWPVAALGRSAEVKQGEICFALGQPNVHQRGQTPLLRLGRMLAPDQRDHVRTTCRAQPGDSGGPLFDLEGRVLGVHVAMESLGRAVTLHAPVEIFVELRERLRAGEEIEFEKDLPKTSEPSKDPWGAWEATDEFARTLSAAHKSTVEVLGDHKVVALGLIVGADGWVLTKRTELSGPAGPSRIRCRLADGGRVEARIVTVSREHDLALLKVPAPGLPAVRWGSSNGLRVSQLIASLGPGSRPLHCAAVGAVHAKNPGVKGSVPITGKSATDGSRGMIFIEFFPNRLEIEEAHDSLKPGDLITHLDAVPTPSVDEFVKVQDKRAVPDALTGEWAKLTVEREGKAMQVFLPLLEATGPIPIPWRDARWNVRRNGFPDVFSHDGGIAYNQCGGPVVDRLGQVIGINIARADPIQTFAIPSDVVQQVIADLKARAQKK
jgi:serine protease Do